MIRSITIMRPDTHYTTIYPRHGGRYESIDEYIREMADEEEEIELSYLIRIENVDGSVYYEILNTSDIDYIESTPIPELLVQACREIFGDGGSNE